MQIEVEALTSLDVKLGGTLHHLRPGETVAFPEAIARKLMTRAAGKVRMVETDDRITVESGPHRLAYWEDIRG